MVEFVVENRIVRGFDVSFGQDIIEDILIAEIACTGSVVIHERSADITLGLGGITGDGKAAFVLKNVDCGLSAPGQIVRVHIADNNDCVVCESSSIDPFEHQANLEVTNQGVRFGISRVVCVGVKMQVRGDHKNLLARGYILKKRPGEHPVFRVSREIGAVRRNIREFPEMEIRIMLDAAIQFIEPCGLV